MRCQLWWIVAQCCGTTARGLRAACCTCRRKCVGAVWSNWCVERKPLTPPCHSQRTETLVTAFLAVQVARLKFRRLRMCHRTQRMKTHLPFCVATLPRPRTFRRRILVHSLRRKRSLGHRHVALLEVFCPRSRLGDSMWAMMVMQRNLAVPWHITAH
jgi:hypothetical protein